MPRKPLSGMVANRHGQQLFLADLFRQKRPPRPQPVVPGAIRGTGRFPVEHEQLVLFPAERALWAVELTTFAVPRSRRLAALLDQAVVEHAAAHGWSKSARVRTQEGVRVLLACQDTPGAAIKASEAAMLAQVELNVQPVLEILAGAGMLDDDRPRPLETWFARQVAWLPEPMAGEVRAWFEVLRDGSTTPPRCRPRSRVTIQGRIHAVLPVLGVWAAAEHRSLREITREDIKAALPASGSPRAVLGQALKSLFTVLKARRVVFANPTTRIRTGRPETRQPLPMNLAAVQDRLQSADPAQAALAALLAFHAPRPGQIRALHLTDVRDGRLYLATHTIVLADPVMQRFAAWLEHRGKRWPNTANPHLFINARTAGRLSPVGASWISDTLGVSAQAVREDRILYEAITTDGDVRRLCDLFGLSIEGAQRYADVVNEPVGSPTHGDS